MTHSIVNANDVVGTEVRNSQDEKLKKSPGFDKDHWPDMSSASWVTSINDYYGTRM